MGRAATQLAANLYENDYEYLIDVEPEVAPLKTNIRPTTVKAAKREEKRRIKEAKKDAKVMALTPINIKVDASCNKCGKPVQGELIGDIMTVTGLVFPFIEYECSCGHHGRRSVFAKALPAREFDRKYYGDRY